MHSVISRLPLQKTTDWVALSGMIHAFAATRRMQHPACRDCTLLRAGDDAGMLVVTCGTREALDHILKNVAPSPAPCCAEI